MKVTIDFLKSKKAVIMSGWSPEPYTVSASSGNSQQISKDVFSFTEYNFLPVDGRTLDGHYSFHVNYKTFEYRVNQDSYYGSLTYTTPAKESGWTKLNEADKKYVEALIASKLLGMYKFDHHAVNQNGENLFTDRRKPELAGKNIYDEPFYRYPGCKRSLISSFEFKLNKAEKDAIKELQH